MLGGPGALIVLVETQIEVLQPLELLLCVVLGSLGTDHILDQDASIFVELVSPVAISLTRENLQVFRLELWRAGQDSGCCGGHFVSKLKGGRLYNEDVNSRSCTYMCGLGRWR